MEAIGHLEKYYLPYLSKNPLLLTFYKWQKGLDIEPPPSKDFILTFLLHRDVGFTLEWHHLFPDMELHQGGWWSIPKQRSRVEAVEKLHDLHKKKPEARYRLLSTLPDRYVIYSQSVCLFMMDQLARWINQTVNLFYRYYEDQMPKREEIGEYVKLALLGALLDNHPFRRLELYMKALTAASILDSSYYWGSFWRMDVCERFKEHLHRAIGEPTANLEKLDDEKFRAEFEKEWRRALSFEDLTGGFYVVPLLTESDMARYANLSRRNQDIVYQMVDYVVLKVCPKLFQTIDHIEPSRFRGWQKLLLGLMRPFVDKVAKEQERVKNEGREEKLRRGLTQEEERELREKVESRILRLATEEYNYLYGKKEIPRDIRILMEEIELNSQKIRPVATKEGFDQKTWSTLLKKEEELTKKLLKASASWTKDPSWINYCSPYLPWGHLLGLRSDEEVREIKKRGAYPREALLSKIKNLKEKYGKAEQEKDWAKAKELARKIGKAEKELEIGQSVLRAREKSRWVRPSEFIYQRIRRGYLTPEDIKSFRRQELMKKDEEDQGRPIENIAEEFGEKQLLDKNVVLWDDSGRKKEYVRLGKLADMLECSPKTLIRMEERGEIQFEWRRVKRREVQLNGKSIGKRGKWMRLFPVEKIHELRNCFKKDKEIAEIAGVRADYLPRLKKKLGLDERPWLEQKKKLLEWAIQRSKNRK